MDKKDDTNMNAQEIEKKLQSALGKCGLSDDQIKTTTEKIRKTLTSFPGQFSQESSYWNFNQKITRSAQLMNIEKHAFVKAALKQPPLFCQSPETINNKITRSAQLMNIEKHAFVKAALKQPSLFYRSPETLDNNITRSAQLINIEKHAFVKAALKQPSLFYQSPETLDNNITRSAQLMNIEKHAFVKAALKQPSLFCQSPETINNNITRSAQLMNIEKHAFVKAALKQPSLFYQSPETLDNKITRSAQLMNIEKHAFVKAALKQPPLFGQSPKTIYGHVKLIREFNERSIIQKNVEHYYLNQPASLSLSDDNFKLRLTFAREADIKNQDNFKLLSTTRGKMEAKMVDLLGYDPNEKIVNAHRTDNGYALLVEMIADKRLKSYKLAQNPPPTPS